MTNPLFSDQGNTDPIDETKNYAEELIGEGKKYRDVNIAARSILEKDRFIEQLKAENANMRASLKGEEKLDEFLDKLKSSVNLNQSAVNSQETPSNEPGPNQQPNQPNQKDILSEVEQILDKRERAKAEQQNLEYAAKKVKEAFGANYVTALKQRAEELGVTEDYLTGIAKVTPAAFLKLVGAEVQSTGTSVPKTSVNTSAMAQNTSGEKTAKYYRELRKKIGNAAFFKPEIQNEISRNATRLGEAFFD